MGRPWKDIGRYGSVGIEFVLTIVIASWVGHWFDGRHGGHGSLGMGIGFLIGVAVGFWNLVRTAQGMQRDIERAEARDPAAGRWTVSEGWLYKPDESAGAKHDPERGAERHSGGSGESGTGNGGGGPAA